jgi:protein-S-isoprenylcysteine O-methyltransferase Ste14
MTPGMQPYQYGIISAGWFIWGLPFLLIKRKSQTPTKLDRRARWGIIFEAIAYSLLWQNKFWERSPVTWRIVLCVLFLALAGLLSWTSSRTLGNQWRFDAGLNADHKLVREGAYSVVRHPIYTSMFCMLLGMGFMTASMPFLAAAVVFFIIGTEIRVRIEDKLLAERFGDEFLDYRRKVGAYIPFVK